MLLPLLKTVVIIPLLKKKNFEPKDVENFRPVSNMPFIYLFNMYLYPAIPSIPTEPRVANNNTYNINTI